MKYCITCFILISSVFMACKTGKSASENSTLSEIDVLRLQDSIEAAEQAAMIADSAAYAMAEENYKEESSNPLDFNRIKGATTRTIDILHTALEVKFDYENRELMGKATIELQPYNKPLNQIQLDAKGFEIYAVMLQGKTMNPLKYTYDSSVLTISLDKTYTKTEKLKVFINYKASPEKLEGTARDGAISSRKGLYFINHDNKDPYKPRQIWTQGEPQSSSAWFPTFDSPNERMTTEILMTVDTSEVTLSNGLMVNSTKNSNGTRTDHWKMNQPHAPYLVMMAVGPFKVYKDKWRNKDVNYYLENNYAPYAKDIFGNTPEMIEFFSKRLGVDYPWDKYSQVVVREFVSGAMENTTAVIHYDELHKTTEELKDAHNENIISHELFHHWFGDYVTCKSWGQLPLNESFATYGEYLWLEHKYGKNEADMHNMEDFAQYMNESQSKQEKMIRYDFSDPEDMFDAHSYQKGGLILHMLRNYVGDENFFEALKLYLNKNKYTAVEIHQLRQAFEEVTGEDLTWFFDQWFFNEGHPKLTVNYEHEPENSDLTINIQQENSKGLDIVYRLPVTVMIVENGKSRTEKLLINEKGFSTTIKVNNGFEAAVLNADKVLLAEITQTHDNAQLLNILVKGLGSFASRKDLLDQLSAQDAPDGKDYYAAVQAMLNDSFWGTRNFALSSIISTEDKNMNAHFAKELERIVSTDTKNENRSLAIDILSELNGPEFKPLFTKHITDKSPTVRAAAILALYEKDSIAAGNFAAAAIDNEKSKQPYFAYMYVNTVANGRQKDLSPMFKKGYGMTDQTYIFTYLAAMSTYLTYNKSEDEILEIIPLLKRIDFSNNFIASYIYNARKKKIIDGLTERRNQAEKEYQYERSAQLEKKIVKLNAIIEELENLGKSEDFQMTPLED